MAEQTSLVAQQIRLMHWAEQIRECQNRPEGMDVSTEKGPADVPGSAS